MTRYKFLEASPEIRSLLKQLRNDYYVCLITNGTSRSQWEKVNKLNLKGFFDLILVSGDWPWEKPNERIFEKACSYFNLNANECCMIGDNIETDIRGGIRANLGLTIWIPFAPVTPVVIRPDITIGNVLEIKSIFHI